MYAIGTRAVTATTAGLLLEKLSIATFGPWSSRTRTSAQKGQVVVVDKLLDTIQEGTRQEFLQLPNNVGNIALFVAPKKGQVVVVEKIACHELWRISHAFAA